MEVAQFGGGFWGEPMSVKYLCELTALSSGHSARKACRYSDDSNFQFPSFQFISVMEYLAFAANKVCLNNSFCVAMRLKIFQFIFFIF